MSIFYHFMEDGGILNITDELHLFCLHLIYTPRINQQLYLWRESWNSHPLSSCANKSPTQLWTEGQPRLPAILPDPVEVRHMYHLYYFQSGRPDCEMMHIIQS